MHVAERQDFICRRCEFARDWEKKRRPRLPLSGILGGGGGVAHNFQSEPFLVDASLRSSVTFKGNVTQSKPGMRAVLHWRPNQCSKNATPSLV